MDKQNLIEKYGIDVNTLDFSIDDFTVEELEEKFKAITEADKSLTQRLIQIKINSPLQVTSLMKSCEHSMQRKSSVNGANVVAISL